ncbi:hypothetical protein [Maricaulis sp.]|uniref:tetratricopeptide repeat protein n=1 Tax=Maricaulis sp. TaxID=1486257 RepID=UPI001AFE03DA|nr:hypothetical protein [Maricaulis sp.]MBO6796053.1 sel1 repeat family protein [Maricaulis sp.]
MLRLATLVISATLLVSPAPAVALANSSSTTYAQDNIDDLRLAAEAGDTSAAFGYGYALTFPDSGDPDYAIGRYWLVQAADAGLAEANHVLGLVYRDGIGTNAELDRARAFFELAWQGQNTSAGLDLADLLIYDYEGEAEGGLAIYRQLSTRNDVGAFAQLRLAEALMFGPEAIEDTNGALAAARSALAADSSLAGANYILGIGSMTGMEGEADPVAARAFWQAGANGGDSLCMAALAQAMLEGDGGEVDQIEALALLYTAAILGDLEAAESAASIEDQLEEAQLTEAEQRSAQYLERL